MAQTEVKELEQQEQPKQEKPELTLKNLQGWQMKKLLFGFLGILIIGVSYLSYTVHDLYQDRTSEASYWDAAITLPDDVAQRVAAKSVNATHVKVGTYIENLKEINLKSSNFRVVFQVWFRWDGDSELDMKENFHIYKGTMNKMEVLVDNRENGVNYQLLRCDATITKDYWTRRFPLESHQLRVYIESEFPVKQVVFDGDIENSGLNPSIGIGGYEITRHAVGNYAVEYDNTHADPALTEPITTSEFVTALEINRSSWGLYAKCFIALVGTITWVMITLFLCTYHRVDPLGMVPAALFGTVSNIMVGANLLPDALHLGLLEYVNVWGIMTILAVTIAIININRIRNKYEDREFAALFGKVMFYTVLTLTLVGHILLPVSSYMF